MSTTTRKDTHTIKINCTHCGEIINFDCYRRTQECDACADWFDGTASEDFHEPDYGGAFDGFTVASDADPGL